MLSIYTFKSHTKENGIYRSRVNKTMFFCILKLECWIRVVNFILVTDNSSFTFLVNKQLDEINPTIARKIIFLPQYNFDIIHKAVKNIPHVHALSRYISKTCGDEEEDIDPVMNSIRDVQERGPLNISGMGLGEMTLEKVRQLQTHDLFYGAQCIVIYKTVICQWKKC